VWASDSLAHTLTGTGHDGHPTGQSEAHIHTPPSTTMV
jgi:hypothetical protein